MKRRNRTTYGRAWLVAGLLAVLLPLTLADARGSGVTPTHQWMDIYGSNSTFAGMPLPAGTYVAVFDPQGAQCGELVVQTPGALMPLAPCYGDADNTPTDEGAAAGDLLTFTINGVQATTYARAHYFVPVPATTPVTWAAQDLWEVDLFIPPQPSVTINQASGQTELTWAPAPTAVTQYQVWRSTDFYFVAGTDGATLLGTAPATGAPLSWPDSEGVHDPDLNYAYRVVSLNADGQIVGASQAVGEFDFALLP